MNDCYYTTRQIVDAIPTEIFKLSKLQVALVSNNFPAISKAEVIEITKKLTDHYSLNFERPMSNDELEIELDELEKFIVHIEGSGNWVGLTFGQVAPDHCREPYSQICKMLARRLRKLHEKYMDYFNIEPIEIEPETTVTNAIIEVVEQELNSSESKSLNVKSESFGIALDALKKLGVIDPSNNKVKQHLEPIITKSAEKIRQLRSKTTHSKNAYDELIAFLKDELVTEIEKMRAKEYEPEKL